MNIEGGLKITLCREKNLVQEVDIQSQRPLQAVNIFHGKAVMEVVRTLPLLYHVCGVAQACAAVTACEQAMTIQTDRASKLAREMLVWMETAREHLWRIMVDWTDRLKETKDKVSLAQLQQILPQLKQALFTDNKGFYPGAQAVVDKNVVQSMIKRLKQILEVSVFGLPLEQWRTYTTNPALQNWLNTADTPAAKMLRRAAEMEQSNNLDAECNYLPVFQESTLHKHLEQSDAYGFVAKPLWRGVPCETTVLSRQYQHPLIVELWDIYGNGLVTRMASRLVELAFIPETLDRLLEQVLAVSPQPKNPISQRQTGVGLAQVEAARGRLVHRIVLEKGIVRRYQILAPTEWNFHPQGIAAQLIKCLPAHDEKILKQQADLLINTIDPCVHYELTVH